eukprot:347290-Chlamydomonas_euryale.AAC.1
MEVMRRIVDERWPIRYAPYMSEESKDLVSKLLERRPVKRIGCFQGRANDIKGHAWFRGFDWEALASRRMEPPRKPKDEDSAKRKKELTEARRCVAATGWGERGGEVARGREHGPWSFMTVAGLLSST